MDKQSVKAYLVEHKQELVKKGLIVAGVVMMGIMGLVIASKYSSDLEELPESEAEVVPESTPEA